jgi:anti-sigma28 factor (negative regulator of flagellin synthesis)
VSLTAGEDGVRADKVSSVQAALAAGTYNVPASAVASKIVDAMLGSQQ